LNDPDKAIRLLKSGSSTTQRCQIQAVAGLAHLTESHALALKQLIQNSKEAALKAEELLPRSPYPKLMLARLAFQEKDFKRASAVYSEVLAINPKQPDALADLNILSRVESGKLSFDDADVYFTLREMAPTEPTMEKLTALHQSAPLFDQLTSLIAWRLLGQNKAEEAGRICASGNTIARTHRFKPNVVIGYGPSSIIAAGYYSVSKRLETFGHDEPPPASRTKDGENDPLRLSISPERLQEILENGSQDNFFSGELRMFSMPDLLEFLRNGRRTGALICSSENGVGAVELRDGYITSAIVPNTDNIGTLLLKKGMIKKEDIENAIDSQHNDLAGTRFGAVLVEKGLVESETIKEIIVEQTFSAIKAMLTWEDGRFAFAPAFDEEFDRAFVEVRLDSQHVLMELYRQLDEQNR
jgi:tetratricopeptide (TPR) repeat protein